MFYPKKSQIFLSKRRQFNQECFEGTAAITGSEDRKHFLVFAENSTTSATHPENLTTSATHPSVIGVSTWVIWLPLHLSFLSVWLFCWKFLLLKLFFQYQRRAMQPDVLDNPRAVQNQISAVQIQVITFFCTDTCQGFLPVVPLLLKGKVWF